MKILFKAGFFTGGLLLLNACVDSYTTPYNRTQTTAYPRQGYYNEQQPYYVAPQPYYDDHHDNGHHYGQHKHHDHDHDHDDDHDHHHDEPSKYGQNQQYYRVNPDAPARSSGNRGSGQGYKDASSNSSEEYQSKKHKKQKHED